jgi:hypothetical protein
VRIKNVGTGTAQEPFVVLDVEPYQLNRAFRLAGPWGEIQLERGWGYRDRASIHPKAFAPTIHDSFNLPTNFPSSVTGRTWYIDFKISIFAANIEPQHFKVRFADTDYTQDRINATANEKEAVPDE